LLLDLKLSLASGATSLWVCPTIRKCTWHSKRQVFIKMHSSHMMNAIVVEFLVSLGVLSAPMCRTRGKRPSRWAAVWRFISRDVHCMLAPCGPSSNIERKWCVSFAVPDHTEPLRPQTTRVPSLKSGELSLSSGSHCAPRLPRNSRWLAPACQYWAAGCDQIVGKTVFSGPSCRFS
jgi:hypothetical protein